MVVHRTLKLNLLDHSDGLSKKGARHSNMSNNEVFSRLYFVRRGTHLSIVRAVAYRELVQSAGAF